MKKFCSLVIIIFIPAFCFAGPTPDRPILLRELTKTCSSSDIVSSSPTMTINFFSAGRMTKQPRDFGEILHEGYLNYTGGPLRAVIKNLSINELIIGPSKELQILNPGEEVAVCQGQEYPEDTVEGVALSTVYAINKTFAQVQPLIPQFKMPQIDLKISPLLSWTFKPIDSSRPDYVLYDADGGFYNFKEQNIVFTPFTEAGKLYKEGFESWDHLAISSHEYSHHIFGVLFGDAFRLKKSKNSKLMRALNEGFADLIAFYTLGKEERSFEGFPCYERNRDIESDKFYDGSLKRFDSDKIKLFLNTSELQTNGTCKKPDFVTLHSFGAVFASITHRLFNTQKLSRELRLKTLLTWLPRMKSPSQELESEDLLMNSIPAYSGRKPEVLARVH